MERDKKVVWIINQYASLPTTGIGGRHRHLSRELACMGHRVSLIAAHWSHLDNIDWFKASVTDIDHFEGFRFVRLPVVKYQGARDKRRILSWFVFAWRILSLNKYLNEKPDTIIYSSPSLIGYLSALKLAKQFGATLIFEVRDIWPLTLVELGGVSSKHPFILLMQWLEDLAYRKSDFVVSNLEGAVEHMQNRGLQRDKFRWLPNGYSEFEFHKIEDVRCVPASSIMDQPFSVTYTGSLGAANSLDTLVEAALLLKPIKRIHFNIFGKGDFSEDLRNRVAKLCLDNVHFWGAVPKAQIQPILQASDVCVICWKDSALYRYGVAANKLFDYLYSGKPVINAYSGGYDVVERYRAGITVNAENPEDLAEAILRLSSTSQATREEMGLRGKEMARRNHEYSEIASRLGDLFDGEV